MNPVTDAIILAAGASKRLGRLTESTPKCLLPLGEKTILDHQVGNLRRCGIERIILVTGFCEEMIRRHCGDSVAYVSNPVFDKTNSIYSLWLGLSRLQAAGVIVLNSDVVFHPDILARLLGSGHPDALTISFEGAMGAEEMKVQIKGDRVVNISKAMDLKVADGENVGLVKFSGPGLEKLTEMVNRLVADGVVNAWAPLAFQKICSYHPIHSISTGGLPWIEIDFPEDLEKARREIYPGIISSS